MRRPTRSQELGAAEMMRGKKGAELEGRMVSWAMANAGVQNSLGESLMVALVSPRRSTYAVLILSLPL